MTCRVCLTEMVPIDDPSVPAWQRVVAPSGAERWYCPGCGRLHIEVQAVQGEEDMEP